jgi:hypothetical protein
MPARVQIKFFLDKAVWSSVRNCGKMFGELHNSGPYAAGKPDIRPAGPGPLQRPLKGLKQ